MQKYNLYLVVSEDLTDCSWGFEPPEKYRICELVNARNKSQATYLAWQNDGNSGYDFRDKPKFSTSIKIKDTGIKVPCIVTDFDAASRMKRLIKMSTVMKVVTPNPRGLPL